MIPPLLLLLSSLAPCAMLPSHAGKGDGMPIDEAAAVIGELVRKRSTWETTALQGHVLPFIKHRHRSGAVFVDGNINGVYVVQGGISRIFRPSQALSDEILFNGDQELVDLLILTLSWPATPFLDHERKQAFLLLAVLRGHALLTMPIPRGLKSEYREFFANDRSLYFETAPAGCRKAML